MSNETKTEQTTEKQKVNWNNLRCLYAEDLHNKRITLTIGGVRETPKGARLFCQTGESEAWDIAFDKPDKEGRTPYVQIPKPNEFGKKTGLLRGYSLACGDDPDPAHVGKAITLYPVKSQKSATGQAIRIAMPEQHA
jgi:hypothetical protein